MVDNRDDKECQAVLPALYMEHEDAELYGAQRCGAGCGQVLDTNSCGRGQCSVYVLLCVGSGMFCG